MYGLYLLDVYVSQLMINKEAYTDTGGSTLVTKVVFINFPATEILERDRSVKDDIIYIYKFNGGQSFHFLMSCEEMVKKMKRLLLKIGVFRLDDNFPICSTQTRLSGCACDLGKVCVEDPTPFVFSGPFELVDSGNSFAGYIDLDVTVINLGRSLVTPYALAPNCFVFKSHPQGPEYKCNAKELSKLSKGMSIPVGDNLATMGNLMMDNLLDTAPPGNLMKDIVGISPVADYLALGSPPPKLPRPPLVDPTLITHTLCISDRERAACSKFTRTLAIIPPRTVPFRRRITIIFYRTTLRTFKSAEPSGTRTCIRSTYIYLHRINLGQPGWKQVAFP
nr:uncharacterized protein LOC117153259 [Bombus vancouverensis nearcticus]